MGPCNLFNLGLTNLFPRWFMMNSRELLVWDSMSEDGWSVVADRLSRYGMKLLMVMMKRMKVNNVLRKGRSETTWMTAITIHPKVAMMMSRRRARRNEKSERKRSEEHTSELQSPMY